MTSINDKTILNYLRNVANHFINSVSDFPGGDEVTQKFLTMSIDAQNIFLVDKLWFDDLLDSDIEVNISRHTVLEKLRTISNHPETIELRILGVLSYSSYPRPFADKLVEAERRFTSTPKIPKKNETVIQKRLAYELGGKREVKTLSGNIDILTNTELIEVKNAKDWKGAIGQLIAYGYDYPKHKKRLHIFGDLGNLSPNHICKVCNKHNITVTFEDP